MSIIIVLNYTASYPYIIYNVLITSFAEWSQLERHLVQEGTQEGRLGGEHQPLGLVFGNTESVLDAKNTGYY